MGKYNITVIVPVYNVEEYIVECIQSILKQTIIDKIEIIIVNDGTKDDSIGKIKNLIDKNDNIVLINKENGGISSARNEGLKFASGEYVIFIDSDDYIESDYIEALYNEAISNNLDITVSGYKNNFNGELSTVNRDYLNTEYVITGIEFLERQLTFNDKEIEVWDDLYRKDFLTSNNLSFKEGLSSEDILFTQLCLLKAKRVKFLSRYGYIYRRRGNSLSNSTKFEKNINSLNIIIQEFVDLYDKSSDYYERKVIGKALYPILSELVSVIEETNNKKYFYSNINKNKILPIMKQSIDNKMY